MPEQDHDEALEAEQREIVQSQIETPSPNDIIERRAELRDSGMDPDQIDNVIRRETLQHEMPHIDGLNDDQIQALLGQKFEDLLDGRLTLEEWRPWGAISENRDLAEAAGRWQAKQREPDWEYPDATPQRSEWYRQTQAEHELDLAAPQRFPLTGDGLVTQRIIADGPFNGPDIGAELALARYRDHQHDQTEKLMPQREIDDKMQAWLQGLLNKAPQQVQQPSLSLTDTRAQTLEQAKEEQTRHRSLSI
jgi:hypothetical protein